MLILLSPAKRLVETAPVDFNASDLPKFFEDAQHIERVLAGFSPNQLMKLQNISLSLAEQNYERNRSRYNNTQQLLYQALFMFSGDAYLGLDAKTLSTKAIDFAQKHLRILSGLYGILRPLDHIAPYRLEMGTQISVDGHKGLYAFWQEKITSHIAKEFEGMPIVNLASGEYSKVLNRKKLTNEIVEVTFKDQNAKGDYKVMSFHAKKARGMMARFIIENQLTSPKDLTHFNAAGYHIIQDECSPSNLVFLRHHNNTGL
jgi:cytoplasmic iron level regulating protein YaaA (DUF328/UPF0246 family)